MEKELRSVSFNMEIYHGYIILVCYLLRKKCSTTVLFLVRIQSEYGKLRIRKNLHSDTFHAVIATLC